MAKLQSLYIQHLVMQSTDLLAGTNPKKVLSTHSPGSSHIGGVVVEVVEVVGVVVVFNIIKVIAVEVVCNVIGVTIVGEVVGVVVVVGIVVIVVVVVVVVDGLGVAVGRDGEQFDNSMESNSIIEL